MEFTSSVVVNRPRTEVFRRIADDFVETQPIICSLTVSVALEGNNPIATGTRGRITVRNTSFTTTSVDFQVKDYSEDSRLVVAAQRGKRQSTDDYVFSDADGGTLLEIRSSFDPVGPSWFRSWYLHALKSHCAGDNRRLKDFIEGTGKPAIRAARTPWRRLVLFVLIAAVLAAAWATYRTLSSQ